MLSKRAVPTMESNARKPNNRMTKSVSNVASIMILRLIRPPGTLFGEPILNYLYNESGVGHRIGILVAMAILGLVLWVDGRQM